MQALAEELVYDRPRAPVTLVFGDDPVRRGRAARLVAGRGGRLAGHVGLGEAVARLDAQAVAHMILADSRDGDADALDALIARIGAAPPWAVLVLVPFTHVDRAAAILGVPGVSVLVDPDEAEIAAELDILLAPPCSAVAEEGAEEQRRRLAALGEEVARIARAIAAIAAEPGPAALSLAPADAAEEMAFLRTHIRQRRMRERFFGGALFADPAWDILLDLRLAALEGRRVAVSSLCIAAAVPATTGLRWIGLMTEKGLLARVADPADGRRVFVALSPAADLAMARFCAAALRMAG